MEHYDVKRLALVLAVQAEIEGMKVVNQIHFYKYEDLIYTEEDFKSKAEEMRDLSACHDEQI